MGRIGGPENPTRSIAAPEIKEPRRCQAGLSEVDRISG
jgi:hypothetical protein